jgi:hypothetical protein
MLYVDRDNGGARALYAKLGFADDHVDRAYTGDVGPAGHGPDIGTRAVEEGPR